MTHPLIRSTRSLHREKWAKKNKPLLVCEVLKEMARNTAVTRIQRYYLAMARWEKTLEEQWD